VKIKNIMGWIQGFLFLQFLCLSIGELTFVLESSQQECFFTNDLPTETAAINVWILRGDPSEEIRLEIWNQNPVPQSLRLAKRWTRSQNQEGTVLVMRPLKFAENERIEWNANQGITYRICFSASSLHAPKVIKSGLQQTGAKDMKQGAFSEVEETIQRIDNLVNQITDEQMGLRIREQTHRDTAEDTNGRVLWFSIFESLILLGISFGQVFYLRRLFNIKPSRT